MIKKSSFNNEWKNFDPYKELHLSKEDLSSCRKVASEVWIESFRKSLSRFFEEEFGEEVKKERLDEDGLQFFKDLARRRDLESFVKGGFQGFSRAFPRVDDFWKGFCLFVTRKSIEEKVFGELINRLGEVKRIEESLLEESRRELFRENLASAFEGFIFVLVESQGRRAFRSQKRHTARPYLNRSGNLDYCSAMKTLRNSRKVVALDYEKRVGEKLVRQDVENVPDAELHGIWVKYGFERSRKNVEKCILSFMNAFEPIFFDLKEKEEVLKTEGINSRSKKELDEVRKQMKLVSELRDILKFFVDAARSGLEEYYWVNGSVRSVPLLDKEEEVLAEKVFGLIDQTLVNLDKILKAPKSELKEEVKKEVSKGKTKERKDLTTKVKDVSSKTKVIPLSSRVQRT